MKEEGMQGMRTGDLIDRAYLRVTAPFMLSTMTQPLMGAANTAVMGRLPDPKYIAAVALGAILFNNLYWLFGFLRVSTSGYAAQALGVGCKEQSLLAFLRPLVLAALISLGCILLQRPVLSAYLALIDPAEEVAALCRVYYNILIWGAPLVLFNYVALGWLMGQLKVRASVFMQVSSDLLNILLSVWFVFGRGLEIEGVAVATLLSQAYGAVVGACLMALYGKFDYRRVSCRQILSPRAFVSMLTVNANLMLRTACLLTVNNILAAVGAALGTTVLAANAVLLQIKDLMSYLIDGMANGAAIFTGRSLGQRNAVLFRQTLRLTYKWLLLLVLVLTAGLFWGGARLIACFTELPEVAALAGQYRVYVLLYPALAGVGLALYGFFTGATHTSPVRNMMLLALAVFWSAEKFLAPRYGNDGLWMAFLLFVGTQSLVLWWLLPTLRRKIDGSAK